MVLEHFFPQFSTNEPVDSPVCLAITGGLLGQVTLPVIEFLTSGGQPVEAGLQTEVI